MTDLKVRKAIRTAYCSPLSNPSGDGRGSHICKWENVFATALGKQLLRAGTSVGANYRAACRSRSRAEFVAKLGIVLGESDECVFWLELLLEAGVRRMNLHQFS